MNAAAAAQPCQGESKISTGAYVGLVVFWVVSAFLALVTAPVANQHGNIWVMRVLAIIVGILLTLALVAREKNERYQKRMRGEPVTGAENAPFDWWTIGHAYAGVLLGIWGVPLPLVAVLTIAWEFFEWKVPGFGECEGIWNRVVDVGIAWVLWLLVTFLVSQLEPTPIPWLVPDVQSLVRDAWLRLF